MLLVFLANWYFDKRQQKQWFVCHYSEQYTTKSVPSLHGFGLTNTEFEIHYFTADLHCMHGVSNDKFVFTTTALQFQIIIFYWNPYKIIQTSSTSDIWADLARISFWIPGEFTSTAPSSRDFFLSGGWTATDDFLCELLTSPLLTAELSSVSATVQQHTMI